MHRSLRLPTTDVNHRLLGKTNKWEHFHRYIPFGNQQPATQYPVSIPSVFCLYSHSCTTQYTRWSMSIDAKPLATKLYRCQYHGSIISCCTSNSDCIHCFCNIKLLNIFYSTLVAYIPQEYHPFTLKPFHHGPYQDHQDLVYHQDSLAESHPRNDPSYWNERPYERRYDRSCSCRCRYYRTYDRHDDCRSCSC